MGSKLKPLFLPTSSLHFRHSQNLTSYQLLTRQFLQTYTYPSSKRVINRSRFQQRKTHIKTVTSQLNDDEYYMRQALLLADEAFSQAEVPVGAILVSEEGTIISRGRNSVESNNDCTCHAEINCLRHAMTTMSAWRLPHTTLFCTLEPCAMCLSALALARVSRIIYAAPDLRLGACGTWVDLVTPSHPFHNFEQVKGGVLADEAAEKMRQFFRKRRLEPSRDPEKKDKPSPM